MRVSIVTPTYNAERFLRATIESVRSQTFTDWEYVIVDDGSSDGTLAVANRYAELDSRIKVVEKPNGGVASARNFGYARTSPESEFVIFLDHDDCWSPDLLEKLIESTDRNPECVASHCLAIIVDTEGEILSDGIVFCADRRKLVGHKVRASEPWEMTTFHTMINACAIPTPGVVLIRRRVLERIRQDNPRGLIFDPDMLEADDWDLYLRLTLTGEISFVDEALLFYRKHDLNRSSDRDRALEATFRVWRKIRKNPALSDAQKEMADWRYRREYATVERHNLEAISTWFATSVKSRRAFPIIKYGIAWMARYLWYLRLRRDSQLGQANLPSPKRLHGPQAR